MPARPTIVLFDVDGTLIHNGGAGRLSMHDAFERVHGRRDATESFTFAGRTDRAIMRLGLEGIGVVATEALIDELLDAYLEGLRRYVPEVEEYRVLPGVAELVEGLREVDGVAVGLGTGNVSEGARIKLERADLNRFFDFGGFGDDAEDRTELLVVGAKRGAELLGRDVDDCDVVVIGDTPRDVHAARMAGARSLAVATGPVSAFDLVACSPHRIATDLTDEGILAWIVGG